MCPPRSSSFSLLSSLSPPCLFRSSLFLASPALAVLLSLSLSLSHPFHNPVPVRPFSSAGRTRTCLSTCARYMYLYTPTSRRLISVADTSSIAHFVLAVPISLPTVPPRVLSHSLYLSLFLSSICWFSGVRLLRSSSRFFYFVILLPQSSVLLGRSSFCFFPSRFSFKLSR